MKPGDKVHYSPLFGIKENGMVKEIKEDNSGAWVVYHCNNDWDNYKDYTGALTLMKDLKEGWV